MGYSITFKPKNKELGKKIIAFLRKNGRSFSSLKGKEEQYLDGPYWADGTGDKESREYGGLSYCHRKGHIGFDYGWDREYKYVFVRWMAQKVGQLRNGHPAYLYDGEEWDEILPEKVDKLGMISNKESLVWLAEESEIVLIKNEMKRLNELWEEEK